MFIFPLCQFKYRNDKTMQVQFAQINACNNTQVTHFSMIESDYNWQITLDVDEIQFEEFFFFIFLFFVLQGHAKLIHLNVLFTVLRYHSTHKTWTKKQRIFFTLFCVTHRNLKFEIETGQICHMRDRWASQHNALSFFHSTKDKQKSFYFFALTKFIQLITILR